MRFRITAALALLLTTTLGASTALAQAQGGPPRLAPLLVESDAFPDGGIVPDKYAFRGGNVQPGFRISHAPPETRSFAVIFHDISVAIGGNPDDVLHWVVWNIPGDTREIPEGRLPAGAVSGKGIRSNDYMGPGAPPGPRYHHYVFEFYALNSTLDLPPTASRTELLEAMKGKVVAKSAYVGRYRGSEAPAAPR